MATRNILRGFLSGTMWTLPALVLLALASPWNSLSLLWLGLLAAGLVLQCLPLLTLPEWTRSQRLAAQGKWAQANYYNILATHRLRKSPWRGGLRPFRTAFQPTRLALVLQGEFGRTLLALGQVQEAEKVLRGVIREFPSDAPAMHHLALALRAQGKTKQAQSVLKQALSLGYVEPMGELLWKRALVFIGTSSSLKHGDLRVDFFQSLGCHDVALACLSLERLPQTPWKQTLSLLALDRPAEAHAAILASLGEQPQNPYCWLGLGFQAALKGHHEEARVFYQKALKLDPSNLDCKAQLYQLLARTASKIDLQNALARLEEHEPDPRHLALCKAHLMAGLGCWTACLREVVQAGPSVRSLPVLELVAYGNLELGNARTGCRLLHRFWMMSEVSGLPMLQRAQRLERCRTTLRLYRRCRQVSAQDSRAI